MHRLRTSSPVVQHQQHVHRSTTHAQTARSQPHRTTSHAHSAHGHKATHGHRTHQSGDHFDHGPKRRGHSYGSGANGRAKYEETARQACRAIGVPESWASSPSLWALLHSENDTFSPTRGHDTHKSSAYGIFQFLNGTWKGTGVAKTSDPYLQFVAGLRYIRDRYHSPDKAWAFKQNHNWY